MSTSRVSPLEAARGIWGEMYGGAGVIFLAGSVMRGEATRTSDLDILVVFEESAGAYRESFTFAGWPVEAFVHDVGSLRHFYGVERRRGLPSLMSGAWLYQDASDFFFRSRGLWPAHSKTVPRRMREVDAEFASKFLAAFESLFAEKRGAAAVALVEELLPPFGGTLFDGFRIDARLREKMRGQ